MFKEVEVKSFKGFGPSGVQVRLGSLTILLGENNSGKTSLLEAIALLAQSAFQSGFMGFKWKGPWLDLGDGSSAWFRSNRGHWLTIGIRSDSGSSFERWLQHNSPDSDRHPPDFGYRVAHRGTTNEWRHELLMGGHVQARNELLVTKTDFRTRSMTQELSLRGGTTFQPHATGGSILAPELFIGNPRESGMPVAAEFASVMNECALLVEYLRENMPKQVFFVGADRGPKEEAPQQMPQDDLSVGRKGEHTLSVLSLLFASSQYAQQSDRIQHWAQEFGMPQLRGGFTRAPILKAGYVDPASQTPLNLESAGFGSQQILPVIVQLFSAPPDSLIMIEEPEISLHPRAQVNLVRMFSEAVASGQQLIITTHSQTFLLALSEAPRAYSMSPDDVTIYHMSSGAEGAQAARLPLDSNWSLKGWVPSFSKVESELLKKWIASAHDDIAKEER
jgi:predicted ATPase